MVSKYGRAATKPRHEPHAPHADLLGNSTVRRKQTPRQPNDLTAVSILLAEALGMTADANAMPSCTVLRHSTCRDEIAMLYGVIPMPGMAGTELSTRASGETP